MMFHHRGHEAGPITFDRQQGILHGEIVGLRAVGTFQGRSMAELRQAFEGSVEFWQDWCEARGMSAT